MNLNELLPDEQHASRRVRADEPSVCFPIEDENARGHIANALQIIEWAPKTALEGKYLSPEDARAVTMRLVAALKELDRHLINGKRP